VRLQPYLPADGFAVLGGYDTGAGDFAVFHETIVVCHAEGKIHELFHKQNGEAAFIAEADEYATYFFNNGGLYAFGGFIEYKQSGFAEKDAAEGKYLLLSSREIAAVAVEPGGNFWEVRGYAFDVGSGGFDATCFQTEDEVFADSQEWKYVATLGYVAESSAGAFKGTFSIQGFVVPLETSGSRGEDAHDGFEKGGFADAIGTHQGEEFTLGNFHAEVLKYHGIAVTCGEILDNEAHSLVPLPR